MEKKIELMNLYTDFNKVVDIDSFDFGSDNTNIIDNNTNDNYMYSYKQMDIPIMKSKQINNTKLVNKTLESFTESVHQRFPFIQLLNMKNICIAGGFCRSILLNQTVNDIDIFFTGLTDEMELKNRLIELITNIREAIGVTLESEESKNVTYMMMYKENNAVYEILCLKKKNIYTKPETKNVESDDEAIESDNEDESLSDRLNNYKLLYKIQIILKISETINDIFTEFDLYPSCVLYDGKQVLMTLGAAISYKYMLNILHHDNYSDIYDERVLKYNRLGFSIGLPQLELNKITDNSIIRLGSCVFKITKKVDNIVEFSEFTINKTSDQKSEIKKSYINKPKGNSLYTTIIDHDNDDENDNILKKTGKYINFINKKSNDNHEKKIHYEFVDSSDKNIIINFIDRVTFVDKIRIKEHNKSWYGEYVRYSVDNNECD